MKKYFPIIVLICLIIISYIIIVSGIHIGNVQIDGYKELKEKSTNLESRIKELKEKNSTDFQDKKNELETASNNYNSKKTEYEKLVPKIQETQGNVNSKVDLYDVDFLWTILGNYATEEGLLLQFDVVQNEKNNTLLNKDYILCDLNFRVVGEYLPIVSYISDLEYDERLNFEIQEFQMKKSGKNIEATFCVKSAPINQNNLLKTKNSNLVISKKR